MKFAYRRMSVLLVNPLGTGLDTWEDYLESFRFYRVWTAKNAEEALELLSERKVELVVSAWKMQPRSGLQLLELIRDTPWASQVPVVLMVDKDSSHLVSKGMDSGAAAVLLQPIAGDKFREAVAQVLSPMVDEEEESFLGFMEQAREARKKGNLPAAERALRGALDIREDEEAQLGLSKVVAEQGNQEGAEMCYLQTIKKYPMSLKAFLGLADLYQAMGRLKDALRVLAAAVVAAKKLKKGGKVEARLYFYMGELELKLKLLKEAMGHFEQASEAAPDDGSLQSDIGDTLAQAGHFEESEQFYQKALELDPELAHVYNKLGIAYRRQEKYDMAIELYNKAMQFHPEDDHLFFNVALCYWHMDRYENTVDWCRKAMEINPELDLAHKLMDMALEAQGLKRPEPQQQAGGQASGSKVELDHQEPVILVQQDRAQVEAREISLEEREKHLED